MENKKIVLSLNSIEIEMLYEWITIGSNILRNNEIGCLYDILNNKIKSIYYNRQSDKLTTVEFDLIELLLIRKRLKDMIGQCHCSNRDAVYSHETGRTECDFTCNRSHMNDWTICRTKTVDYLLTLIKNEINKAYRESLIEKE